MSSTIRNSAIVLLVLLMAGMAFTAGYLTNEFVGGRPGAAQAAEEFSLFWEAWGHVERNYIGRLPAMQRVTYGAIRGALEVLEDPYTVFIEPQAREEERDSLRGNFGGIGANITRNEAGDVVLSPIPGNPAEAAGLLEGDILLAVDGQTLGPEITVTEIAELIRGEKGTTVTLTVRHPGATEAVEVTVERDDILIPSVSYRILPEAPAVGYIQLSRFSGESAGEVEDAINALQQQGAQQLILDLRHNGGGLLNAAVEVADHFLEGGVVLYQESRGEDERVFEASEETVAPAIPLVVLVDGGTASSSEILAGALQDRDRGLLMGTQTFGKGSVQLVYDLSDGSSVHVTASRWYTPNRHEIDRQGLAPDVVVEASQEAIDAGRDEVLERAVEYLTNGNS